MDAEMAPNNPYLLVFMPLYNTLYGLDPLTCF